MAIGSLSAKYESNDDGGCISTGYMDAGGKSYGAYQLASNAGSVREFLNWIMNSGDPIKYQYGKALAEEVIGSYSFDCIWKEIADNDGKRFLEYQHDYIKYRYYDVSVRLLKEKYFNIEKHSEIMKDVVWSRAVQYGTGYIVEMFEDALVLMEQRLSQYLPNLSYVDDFRFDWDIISCIYDVCMSEKWNSSALRDSLNQRFKNERMEALRAFEKEVLKK